MFQQVDDSLIELLEKRQEVVDQEPECRQQHVIVDFIFHETILEESVNLLLNTFGFPKQPLFHQKRSQPAPRLTGAIIWSLIPNVIYAGQVKLLDPNLKVFGVLDDIFDVTIVAGVSKDVGQR